VTIVVPRFWAPPEASLALVGEGFLPDPEEPFGGAYNPDLVTLAQKRDTRCLILVGDPGLGKSIALAGESTALREVGTDEVLEVDLGATGQESILWQRTFESDQFQAWRSGTGVLSMLLDSLDEARLRIETIADLLLLGLEGADIDRLRLRIACRSADRHTALESTLRERFGSERSRSSSSPPCGAAM
jgi:hypothetical protein